MKQWRKMVGGWEFIGTTKQGGGIGFSWHGSRYNGVTVFLGPLIVDIVPPLPKWLADEMTTKK